MNTVDCAIIAGGKGTRLGLRDIPKPMVPVGGKPLLEHQVELVKKHGIGRIFILSGYLSEVITSYFKRGEAYGIPIEHLVEESPLGTAGALKQLEGRTENPLLVLYGDVYVDMDLSRFIHVSAKKGGLGSLVVHPNDHPQDSDLLDIDKDGRITSFFSKPRPEGGYYRNLVSAALYYFNHDIFTYIPRNTPSDFGKNIFPAILKDAQHFIYAYSTPEYVKDLGTPERLKKVEKDINSGKTKAKNLSNPQRAVFFDRDGIINREIGGVTHPDDFELLPWAVEALKKVNETNLLAICVTNQPVIAKGFCSEEAVLEIHKKMETLLGREGVFFDGIYYCPHHPEQGFRGEVRELKIDCECRKPKPGMLLRAAQDFNIDLSLSYMIGDRETDVEAGKRGGCKKTVLISEDASAAGAEMSADLLYTDLVEAVSALLKEEK